MANIFSKISLQGLVILQMWNGGQGGGAMKLGEVDGFKIYLGERNYYTC